ncbi:unnamed protein product [Rotaria sp. Silwood1]|nr:unnamed protein product [Rotaria sp. Silwood1]
MSTMVPTDTSERSTLTATSGFVATGSSESLSTVTSGSSTSSLMTITHSMEQSIPSSQATLSASILSTSIILTSSSGEVASTSSGSSTIMSTGAQSSPNTLSTPYQSEYTSQSATSVSEGSSVPVTAVTQTQGSSAIIDVSVQTASSTKSANITATIFEESTTVATSVPTLTSFPSTTAYSSAIQNITVVSSIPTSNVEVTTQVTLSSTISSSNVVTATTISQTISSTLTSISITGTAITTAVTSQTLISTNLITSTTTSMTTTPAPANLIFTVFKASIINPFDPYNTTHVEKLRRGLSDVINLGFLCLNNASISECLLSSRRKRQINQNYLIEIISSVVLLSDPNTFPKTYRVNYTVTDTRTNKTVSATDVKTATDKINENQKISLLGFQFDGNFVQSPSIQPEPSTLTTDNKLWIIGAVLGPIAFVLLLISLSCIYFKWRKRGNNQSNAEVVYNVPQTSSRALNYHTVSNELRQEQATPLNNARVLTQNDILLGNTASSKRSPRIKSQTTSNNIQQFPVTADIPMQETRYHNDVEHWRNKLRLQEKFEQRYADPLNDLEQVYNSSERRTTPPITNRSRTYQYNNPVFESEIPQTSEMEVGRTKLHRLLDEVLDQAEPKQPYNTDSVNEQQRQRRQRRPVPSTAYDPRNPRINNDNEQIYHTPNIPQVSERPDSNLIRLHYDPYEAGDRVHDIEHSMPVVFKPKYPSDDNDIRKHYSVSSFRSNPPLFNDDSILNDRARTTTMDPYSNQRRQPRTRTETDREFMMHPNRGHIGQRQHKFDNDAVYIDTIPKNRDGIQTQIHNASAGRDDNNDRLFHLNSSDLNKRHDYRDEYLLAKQSVVNTKNLVSAIHDDLQQIISDPSSDSHYV